MSTITVTARGVKTVNDALEEVDAVVEALKDRAEGVLTMLGQELCRWVPRLDWPVLSSSRSRLRRMADVTSNKRAVVPGPVVLR